MTITTCGAVSTNRYFTLKSDGTLQIWDSVSNQCVESCVNEEWEFPFAGAVVHSVHPIIILYGVNKKTMFLVHVSKLKYIEKVTIEEGRIRDVKISHDGARIVVGCTGGFVSVFDFSVNQHTSELFPGDGISVRVQPSLAKCKLSADIHSIDIHTDSKCVAMGGKSGVCLWQMTTSCNDVEVSENIKTLVSKPCAQVMFVYSPTPGLLYLDEESNHVHRISMDGTLLWETGWDTSTFNLLHNGQFLATAWNTIHVYDVVTCVEMSTFVDHRISEEFRCLVELPMCVLGCDWSGRIYKFSPKLPNIV